MFWLIPENIPLPEAFKGFDPDSPLTRDFDAYERHLPHWRVPGCCYFITFRLRDSVPAEIWTEMQNEAEFWAKRIAQRKLKPEEWLAWQDFQQTQLRKLEQVLDEGRGECLLQHAEHRKVLAEALHHFDGSRCELLACVLMPNHVHVLCRPLGEHTPESLTRSWKRHSSDCIHRLLGRSGPLWQEESFDRIIRDVAHYRRVVRYIAKNPAKAGLKSSDATVWLHPKIVAANAGT